MGPSCRKRTTKSSSSRRRRSRRALFKKHLQSTKNQDNSLSSVSPAAAAAACSPVRHFTDSTSDVDSSKLDAVESANDVHYECSTPKGERFRLPEIMTCPPAPKKRRTIASCSLKRTPIAFYAPPDIELFFHLALRGIPV